MREYSSLPMTSTSISLTPEQAEAAAYDFPVAPIPRSRSGAIHYELVQVVNCDSPRQCAAKTAIWRSRSPYRAARIASIQIAGAQWDSDAHPE